MEKKEELLLELRSPFDAHRNAIDHDKSPTKPSWYSMDSHYQRLKSTLKNSSSRLVFERLNTATIWRKIQKSFTKIRCPKTGHYLFYICGDKLLLRP